MVQTYSASRDSKIKKLLLATAALLFAASSFAQSTRHEMDSLRNSFLEYRGQAAAEFNEYVGNAFEEYFSYVEKARAEIEAYNSAIRQTWGGRDMVESSRTVWVEYGPDRNDRSVVDFEKGEVTVEVIIPEGASDDDVDAELTAALERMLASRGSTCPYPSSVDKAEPLTEEPIMEGLIDMSPYSVPETGPASAPVRKAPPAPTVKSKTLELNRPAAPAPAQQPQKSGSIARKRMEEKEMKVRNAAKAIAEQSRKEVKTVVGDDGQSRRVAKVKMTMVTDNLTKNAALYKDIVSEFSQKFNVEEPLIYAVMEQESSFNPEAKSWVPAYGLMQLVPVSGGFDAYRYVYGKEWVPTQSYLYNPRNNIELGTAYLRILMNQFSKVSDENCRRLCVIAGYNTGAGNVSRAFTGKTNLKTAVPMINEHNYNSLYDHLTSRLSTDEARNYVSGVSRRREKYIKR